MLDELIAAYHQAVHADDVEAELAALEALTSQHPELAWPWFDLGTRHKWLRLWPESVNANLEALARTPDPTGTAEAWNLGIAATALGEWALARQAWDAFGVDVPDGEGPILADFGVAAIGLNPSPRFHEPELLLDGVRYADEVVLARRLCPATARIEGAAGPGVGTPVRRRHLVRRRAGRAGDVRRPDDARLQRDHAARAVGVPHSRRDRAERRGGRSARTDRPGEDGRLRRGSVDDQGRSRGSGTWLRPNSSRSASAHRSIKPPDCWLSGRSVATTATSAKSSNCFELASADQRILERE